MGGFIYSLAGGRYLMQQGKKRILTGDRPTGNLHLGHYVGSLANRVKLQKEYDSFIIIADVQALTTHWEKDENLSRNVYGITLDYLAAGIDPEQSTIFIQSMIPEIHELTMYYSMFTSVNVLRHNPTVKSEAAQHGFQDMTYGFLGYPVSQAADISIFKAHLVPVGDDQIPHIELARKIVRRFNDLYRPVLVEPEALVGDVPRLVGLDGKAKMSKRLNNAVFLSDSSEQVDQKIRNAVTDPARIRKTDPGHPEICTVFEYHRVFNAGEAAEIESDCRSGSIGCVACKKRLAHQLNSMLEPMRERRGKYQNNPKQVKEILMEGTRKAHSVARETMVEVRQAMNINYFDHEIHL
jgi:tryptophanyl-tRNA synthetase